MGSEPTPEPLRRSRLPDGRELVVREVVEADLPALDALYAGLDDAARYRRFFSLYRPGDRFFRRLLDASRNGGACLVVLVGEGDDEELVAEADYQALPNGDAELAMTVDAHWRGWLGPYLLDALVEHAAAHGIPNLEADALVTNRPMRALLRSRRCGTLPRAEWTVERAIIGVDGGPPRWPPQQTGRRVLLEGGSGHWPTEDAADAAGYEVIACAGPGTCPRRCPLLAGEPCPLVDGADAVVMVRSTTGPTWDRIRAAHRDQHPDLPVIVESGSRSDGPGVVEAVAERLGDGVTRSRAPQR
jgi:GNAT superfamily N-acetyltransferase